MYISPFGFSSKTSISLCLSCLYRIQNTEFLARLNSDTESEKLNANPTFLIMMTWMTFSCGNAYLNHILILNSYKKFVNNVAFEAAIREKRVSPRVLLDNLSKTLKMSNFIKMTWHPIRRIWNMETCDEDETSKVRVIVHKVEDSRFETQQNKWETRHEIKNEYRNFSWKWNADLFIYHLNHEIKKGS